MKEYRFVDWATQGYVVLVGLVLLLFHGDAVPGWHWLVLGHLAVAGMVHALVRLAAVRPQAKWLGFLRDYYPILLYTAFYRETGLVNQMFITGYIDPMVMRWDEALFGFQPSLVWMERMPQRWLAEVMYGCYFSYYFMIAGVGLLLWFRSRQQFTHFISVVSVAFYCCYFLYVILPVAGPRIFYMEPGAVLSADPNVGPPGWGVLAGAAPEFPASVQSAWVYQIVIALYRVFESEGAALPSSHVALALVTLYFSWIYLARLRWLHLVLAIGLLLSTVYCRYHYVVDVVGALLLVMILIPVANRLYWRFERRGEAEKTVVPAG